MINDIIRKQKNILMNNYLSTEECVKIILEKKYTFMGKKDNR